jgi:hypothetical protein
MSSVSKQHAQVFDDVDAMLAMNPNLSLDELNAALNTKFRIAIINLIPIFVA